MLRSLSFPHCQLWRSFVWLYVVLVFNHFHTKAPKPRGTVVVFVSNGRWHLNQCQLLTALQRLQTFTLTTMSQRRHINSPRQVSVLDILLSSAYSFILSREGKEKNIPFFFTTVLHYRMIYYLLVDSFPPKLPLHS